MMRWIYPPTIAWEGEAVFQRPQQIFRTLALAGEEVIFVESGRQEGDETVHVRDGVKIVGPMHRPHPTEEAVWLWITHPPHLTEMKERYQADFVIFDYMDEAVEEFSVWNDEHLQMILIEADLITVVSHKLYEKVKEMLPHKEVLYLANAADLGHFRYAKELPCPPELAYLVRPRIGFIGSLSTWIDIPLLLQAIRSYPESSWIFIGPHYVNDIQQVLSPLPHVHFLPRKTYYELATYVGHFDVGTVPFEVRPMTHSSSPIKMYEYIAAGLPVVSTPIREALHCPFVQTAATGEEWSQLLRQCWRENDPNSIRQRQNYARQESWRTRGEQLLTKVQQYVEDKKRKEKPFS